ncbi:UPF0182 family protein [Salinifilum aidingensis]
MAMRPPAGMPKLSRRARILLILGGVVLVALIAGSRLLGTYVNWLWFGEVGYRQVMTTQLLTRLGLGLSVAVLLGAVVLLSLWLAYRSRPVFVPASGPDDPLARYRTVLTERSRLFGLGIPILVAVFSGLAAQAQWQVAQLFFNSVPFGKTDPEFGNDISFYTFELPFWRMALTWAFVAVALAFFAALVTHYVFGGIRLAGRSGQFSVAARVQLAIWAGIFVLLKAVDYFLARYDLLLSSRNDLFTGASYTDLHAVLPAKLILMFIALFCAVAFFAVVFLRNLQIPALATVLLVLSSVVLGAIWPALMEQFSVRPNANQREAQSIERNLTATKDAYRVDDEHVNFEDYAGRTQLQPQEVAQDKGTIPNIRLLDPAVLEPTFTQLTQQYNFYGFTEKLDVVRYRNDQGELQDYLVGLREIDTQGLAANQRTWINRHMVYTHGNGLVSAPADRVNTTLQEGGSEGGYPVFSISDVANNGQGKIPVEQPRIYYGELVGNRGDYAITGGDPGDPPREYDTDTQRYTYTGEGGVPLDNPFKRLVFAAQHGERNILFNQAIGSNSKILYERNPRDRVQKVAPFLKLDGDPYPAVVNGRIKWIVDGYTTLDNYPYSQRTQFGQATQDTQTGSGVAGQPNEQVNYIRNSVKATVDAYDGSVDLYTTDQQDPVLKAWKGVFPGLIKPASEISPELRKHFRYPEDLFKTQREILTKYHVDDPGKFYATQTFWEVPPDPTKKGEGESGPQPPYYVVAQTRGQEQPTFQLMSPVTQLRRQNLAAWMSASSDPQNYGEINVLRLPTNTQTPGPNQVQNQMESTPEVTENRTLFNNPNVSAIFGNLLTLPVAGGLLYVEPIYIQRNEEESYPQLARVLVSFGGRVGFHETLDGALEQVFGAGAGSGTETGQGQEDGQQQRPPQDGQQPQADQETAQAVEEINAALEHLRSAQSSGNYGEIGTAYQELGAAIERYKQAQGG